MAKATIYTSLMSSKTITVKECPLSGDLPYHMNINKVLSNPELFDTISLLVETTIKTKELSKDLKFNKICATSSSAIPYATNIATSFEKGILYITNEGNDVNDKDNIKNLKIEGGMNIDDKVLIVETIVSNDFLLHNIVEKIKKYGGNVVGIIILLNQCEGEYVNLTKQIERLIPILNIYDIINYLENNNLIEIFYCERVKFYCEKQTKFNIKKLLESDKKEIIENIEIIEPKETIESTDIAVVN